MHQHRVNALPLAFLPLFIGCLAQVQTTRAFDGSPWNISSGNLSVTFIQASPIGAFPRTNFFEAPPSLESQKHLKSLGLVANEDYVAWGAIERQPGQWLWKQHDAMEQLLHQAGLKYVVYDWVHFPPVWLREQPEKRTLMRCIEHGQEANYLSIFDPRTLQWYDHFYKHLAEHFGSRVDDVYACILGPYGEGNYPLRVPDWVNMGHCHEGYWCGDAYATKAFQSAMRGKYRAIKKLNRAWDTKYRCFEEVKTPPEIGSPEFKATPAALSTASAKRRWLDFITWYHQAIIDFAGQSIQTVLKYFPAKKVRTKPGGTAAGVNPIAWGTYCPGYARMAGKYHIVLQPADCQGAVFADKWAGTAYQFYGVKECTEPAGALDEKRFTQRMFSDASGGASQLFTYEFESHAAAIQKYVHLFTGQPGETEIALFCPTTWYRLGGDLQPTIRAAYPLRDLCDFDVLDELLITDGALSPRHYRVLLMLQAGIVDQPILDKIQSFMRRGGKVIVAGADEIRNVEGDLWKGLLKVKRISAPAAGPAWLEELAAELADCKGADGQLDGLWTCRRKEQVFVYNSKDKPVTNHIGGVEVTIAPRSIWWNR
jgi:Glycosyl hydrolase family 14